VYVSRSIGIATVETLSFHVYDKAVADLCKSIDHGINLHALAPRLDLEDSHERHSACLELLTFRPSRWADAGRRRRRSRRRRTFRRRCTATLTIAGHSASGSKIGRMTHLAGYGNGMPAINKREKVSVAVRFAVSHPLRFPPVTPCRAKSRTPASPAVPVM